MNLHLLFIEEELRETFKRLESYLNIKFDSEVIDAVFEDADSDNVSFKFYTFYRRSCLLWPAWTIEGVVDEYEPETVWLQSRGGWQKQQLFDAFFKKRP